MYRQGLGDCFLLCFGGKKPTKTILIDCGVILGTEKASEKMAEVVEHIAKDLGSSIDVVVATHEHWDHVSGFVQAKDAFDEISFGEIWFAWTESPDDDQASGLRKDRTDRRKSLAVAIDHWKSVVGDPKDEDDPTGVHARMATAESVLGFFHGELLGAAASTSDAMEYLQGRKEHKRYLEPGTSFALPDVPDVRVFVLGPPRDMAFIKKTLPSKRAPETYEDSALAMAPAFFAAVAAQSDPASGDDRSDAQLHPFDHRHRLPLPKDPDESFIGKHYLGAEEWRRIDYDWLGATADLAIALDNDTNNTSLVLAFELGEGGDVLLFPGDAQVGNWLSWEDMEFKVPKRDKPVTAADLLSRVVFYKVGHHASHNATLREKGLERMTNEDLHAMVPVDSDMALKKK